MKTILATLFFFAAMGAQAQPVTAYYTEDTILCYNALCPHLKTYQEAFLGPWDGCVGFENQVPAWGSLVLIQRDKILLDTCIYMNGDGIPTEVCWQTTDTTKLFLYGPDSSTVHAWHFPGSGNPLLGQPIVDTDTLCPSVGLQQQAAPDPLPIIDIITGIQVQSMQPNRPYLVGRKLQIKIE